MSLRKSPERTPALLAALRRNAQKCTGPKTPQGKARSSLNPLKHGRFAQDLASKIRAAGIRDTEGEINKRREEILRVFWNPRIARTLADRCTNTLACAMWFERKVGRHLPRPDAPGHLSLWGRKRSENS